MKRTGPTNPLLRDLIGELKKRGNEQEVNLWKRIALDLERPTRQRRAVNLSRINRHTKENEVVVVPGKVLSVGEIDHKINVAAFNFSALAKEKILKAHGKALSIDELMKLNPKGKGIKIIG